MKKLSTSDFIKKSLLKHGDNQINIKKMILTRYAVKHLAIYYKNHRKRKKT